MMRNAGLHSSFTLALQTLNDDALGDMNRRNMKINQWRDLAAWLADEGLDAYAELIWGAPGETPESFLRGYDFLARHVSRIAAYPLLLLPNTDYTDNRSQFGFITVRGERDDFEYVLATKDVPLEEHLRMQRFLFWARLLAENLMLRDTWSALRASIGLSQSSAILSLADWIESSQSHGAGVLTTAASDSTADPDSLAPALEFCFSEREFDEMVLDWCASLPLGRWRDAIREVVRFDLDTRPLPDPLKRGFESFQPAEIDGVSGWAVERSYEYDVAGIASEARQAEKLACVPRRQMTRFSLFFPRGFSELARSTNHEETAHFIGRVSAVSAAGKSG